MEKIDTILHATWIAAVDKKNTVYQDHALLIDQGVVKGIVSAQEAQEKYSKCEIYSAVIFSSTSR